MSQQDLVKINYDKLKAQTDKAVCLEIANEDYWFPKSKIEGLDPDEYFREDEDFIIEIPEWLAIEKKLV